MKSFFAFFKTTVAGGFFVVLPVVVMLVLLLFVTGLMPLGFGFASDNPAVQYREIQVTDGGRVTGKVRFSGPLPEGAVERIPVRGDAKICGDGPREIAWIDVEGQALRGVFVFLEEIIAGKPWPEPEASRYLLDQRECRFTPWAQVVEPGPIVVRNSDEGVLHNVHARELLGVEQGGRPVRRTLFNLGQPGRGERELELLPRASPFVAVNCEAHEFMRGYLMAPDHPYAVVVDERGRFRIEEIPAGEHTIRAWHPRLGGRSRRLTLEPGTTVEVTFEFGE